MYSYMRSRSDRTTGINVFQVFLNTSSLCHVTDRGRAFVCSVSSGVQSIFSRQFAFNDAFGALVFYWILLAHFRAAALRNRARKWDRILASFLRSLIAPLCKIQYYAFDGPKYMSIVRARFWCHFWKTKFNFGGTPHTVDAIMLLQIRAFQL